MFVEDLGGICKTDRRLIEISQAGCPWLNADDLGGGRDDPWG